MEETRAGDAAGTKAWRQEKSGPLGTLKVSPAYPVWGLAWPPRSSIVLEFSYSQGPQGWTGPVLSLPDVFIADLPYFLPSIGWDGLVQRTPCANQKEGQIPLFALSPTMPGRSGWLNPWPGGKPAGLRLGPQKVGEGAEEAQAGEKGWPPPGDRDWDS